MVLIVYYDGITEEEIKRIFKKEVEEQDLNDYVKELQKNKKSGWDSEPNTDYVTRVKDGLICGCCKHFHSGVRDRCDKDNNWVLKNGSCQDFER